MARPKPFIATLQDVQITREGTAVHFSYLNRDHGGQRIEVGENTTNMSDLELLEIHNHIARKMIESSRNYEHIAIEIPEGKSQISYDKNCCQWVAKGEVIRCIVGWDEQNEGPLIEIDDKVLTWQEFGKLVSTWEGWGMRITCVPDDELSMTPTVVFGERDDL